MLVFGMSVSLFSIVCVYILDKYKNCSCNIQIKILLILQTPNVKISLTICKYRKFCKCPFQW